MVMTIYPMERCEVGRRIVEERAFNSGRPTVKRRSSNRKLGILFGVPVLAILAVRCTPYREPEVSEPQAERFPANTIVVRYDIAPEALADVHNSAELITALRNNLMVEAATALDSGLVVQLSGRFGQISDGGYEFGSGIIMHITPNQPVNGTFASFPIQTYGDWDEDEAWQYFREETESGLVNSFVASGGFARDENGRVPLTVVAVRTGYLDDEDQDDLGDGMVLELWPERRYKTESRFGSPTPPEGYTEDVQVVMIELIPAPAVTARAAASDPSEETDPSGEIVAAGTITVSTEVLDRLAGEYGEGGRSIVIRSDGTNLLFSNPDDPESEEWTLYPLSEKEFWTDYNGIRVELSFSRDDEGQVFAVTIKQMGNEKKLPRLR